LSFTINKTEFQKIQTRLGRSIDTEGGKLANYSEISDSDISDLRLLAQGSSIDAINFLLYRLDGKYGLANASSYISEVVKGNMSSQQWIQQFHKSI